ncbi:hypothetical protein J6590_013407 [Homalodisca vitripennis]|nr:hypothetical protein J6590_013407 [Homalodisca vitripennis]
MMENSLNSLVCWNVITTPVETSPTKNLKQGLRAPCSMFLHRHYRNCQYPTRTVDHNSTGPRNIGRNASLNVSGSGRSSSAVTGAMYRIQWSL